MIFTECIRLSNVKKKQTIQSEWQADCALTDLPAKKMALNRKAKLF